MRRDFFMQFTDFHTPSGVALVPRLRGDDGKEEAGMTVVLGKPTSIEEAGMMAVMGWGDGCIRHG